MLQIKTHMDDAAAGQIVIIGSANGKGSVLVRHTASGEEFDLLDQVQMWQREKMRVLAVRCMTYAEVEQFHRMHRKSWRSGYWFKRTAAIERAVRTINAEADRAYRQEIKRAA